CQSLIDQNPKDADSHKLLADCRRLRGEFFKANKQFGDALQAYHEALSGGEALVMSRPDEPSYPALHAGLWMNVFDLENDRLFDLEGKEDHAAAARAAVKQAREILDALVKEVPEETTNQFQLASVLTSQFDLEKNEGRK